MLWVVSISPGHHHNHLHSRTLSGHHHHHSSEAQSQFAERPAGDGRTDGQRQWSLEPRVRFNSRVGGESDREQFPDGFDGFLEGSTEQQMGSRDFSGMWCKKKILDLWKILLTQF